MGQREIYARSNHVVAADVTSVGSAGFRSSSARRGALRALLGRLASEWRGGGLEQLAWRSSFRMASLVLLSVWSTESTLTELRGAALASCQVWIGIQIRARFGSRSEPDRAFQTSRYWRHCFAGQGCRQGRRPHQKHHQQESEHQHAHGAISISINISRSQSSVMRAPLAQRPLDPS